MDTLSDLIEVKGIDSCLIDEVSVDKLSVLGITVKYIQCHDRAMAVNQYILRHQWDEG